MYSSNGRRLNLDSASSAESAQSQQRGYEVSEGRSRKRRDSRASEQPANLEPISSRRSGSRPSTPNSIATSDGRGIKDFSSEQKQAPSARHPVPDLPARFTDRYGESAPRKPAEKTRRPSIVSASHILREEPQRSVRSPEGHGPSHNGDVERRQPSVSLRSQASRSSPSSYTDSTPSRRTTNRSKQTSSPAGSLQENLPPRPGSENEIRSPLSHTRQKSTNPRSELELLRDRTRSHGSSTPPLRSSFDRSYEKGRSSPAFTQTARTDSPGMKKPHTPRKSEAKAPERREAIDVCASSGALETVSPDNFDPLHCVDAIVSPIEPRRRPVYSSPREDKAVPLVAATFVKHSYGTMSPLNPLERTKYDASQVYVAEGNPTRDKGRRRSKSTSQPLKESFDSTPSSSGVGNYVTASDFSSDQTVFPPVSTLVTERSIEYQDASLSNRLEVDYDTRSWKNPSSTKGFSSKSKPEVTSLRSSRLNPRNYYTKTVSDVQVENSETSKVAVHSMLTKAANKHMNGRSDSPPVDASPAISREERTLDQHYKALSISNVSNSQIALRHDDSMTYVAVTTSGSSPQSEPEDVEDVSDMSEYPDKGEAETEDMRASSYWPDDDGLDEYSQSVKRREALLTGLGLGLSNVNASAQIVDIVQGPRERQEEDQNISFGVASSYSYDVTMVHEEDADHDSPVLDRHPLYPNNETQWIDRSTQGGVSQPSHARDPILVKHSTSFSWQDLDNPQHTTPRPRSNSKSKLRRVLSEPDNATSTPKTEWNNSPMRHGEPTQEEFVDPAAKDNARRNTWVYDGSDLPKSTVEPEVLGKGRLDDNRNDSFLLVWSDNDSLDEPLSENAQRMFKDLQQQNKSRSGTSSSEASSEGNVSKLISVSYPYEELSTSVNNDSFTNSTHMDARQTPEQLFDATSTQSRTWRNTVTGQAYNSLLEKHGITEMKRQDVIFELCETEITFVKSMKAIQRLFASPLKSQGQWFGGLPQIYTRIFDWLEDIVQVHSGLASALHSARSSQFPIVLHFAEYVRPFVPRLEVHQPYLVHLEEVIKDINNLLRDPESKLGEFIKVQSSNRECGNLSLTSFLLQPMQRLTKYPLFFKQLWEMTPRSHPDHLPMFALYNSTHLMITVMQEVKTREEEFNYVKDLASRISGFPPEFCLAQRERRLIAQGLLRRVALSDKDRDILDGLGTSTPLLEPSPRLPSSFPQVPSPQTPSFPDLAKIGPITSPLFPAYHNRTPVAVHSSPYSPRRSFMSVISRASTALSEATRMSDWTSSYSPTSSINIPSDVDSRPESSTSYASSLLRASSITSGRSKTREMPVYAFLFTDLVLLTTQTEKHGLFQSKSTPQSISERMSLVDNIGMSRVLGVTDRSLKLADYNHLLEVDLLPMTQRNDLHEHSVSSVFLTLPSVGNSRVKLKPTEELMEAKDKWLSAFDRCYGYTLRALSFPSIIAPGPDENLGPSGQSSVMSLLSSGLPLPKKLSHQDSMIEDEQYNLQKSDGNSREWWSRRFQEVLRDIEHTQDAPVMLIGDGALTMGRGLKKVNTSDRTRRNGPQQLLLPAAAALNSPSNSSSSGNGKKSLLGIRKR